MASIKRRIQEFSLIGRDPVLALSLIISSLFLFSFVVFPILRTVWSGFFDTAGAFSLTYFARYFDSYYGPVSRQIFWNTLKMGIFTAGGGTLLGFIFAYTIVRCKIPGRNFIHLLALVPTVSPPFAIALSTILLFGRNGLITKGVLNINFGQIGRAHV
jgi:iron(III) transport system permease protein